MDIRNLVLADGRKTPFKDEQFDMVVIKHVLNPSEDPEGILREALRVCKSNGEVVVFPVMAFVDVDEIGINGLSWRRMGLDYFVLTVSPDKDFDKEEFLDLIFRSGDFAVKPVRGETTQKRLGGYYYQESK